MPARIAATTNLADSRRLGKNFIHEQLRTVSERLRTTTSGHYRPLTGDGFMVDIAHAPMALNDA